MIKMRRREGEIRNDSGHSQDDGNVAVGEIGNLAR